MKQQSIVVILLFILTSTYGFVIQCCCSQESTKHIIHKFNNPTIYSSVSSCCSKKRNEDCSEESTKKNSKIDYCQCKIMGTLCSKNEPNKDRTSISIQTVSLLLAEASIELSLIDDIHADLFHKQKQPSFIARQINPPLRV